MENLNLNFLKKSGVVKKGFANLILFKPLNNKIIIKYLGKYYNTINHVIYVNINKLHS